MSHLHGLDEQDHAEAQQDEQGGMAALVWPVVAIAATVACWVLAVTLPRLFV
jgi:hypothetical protein